MQLMQKDLNKVTQSSLQIISGAATQGSRFALQAEAQKQLCLIFPACRDPFCHCQAVRVYKGEIA